MQTTRTIRSIALFSAACATVSAPARATELRRLSLVDAVDLALRAEPLMAEARIAEDRARLSVLRAQLDRISVKVDGVLTEQWNKVNIGGPTVYDCTAAGSTFQADPATCASVGGMSTKSATQSPESTLGLLNLSANVAVPVFSGLRIESNVSRTQRLRDATIAGLRQTRKDTALAVARAYWQVRRVGLLERAQEETLRRLGEAEIVTGARVKAGLAPPIDRNRAVLRKLQQSANLEDLRGQRRESTAQLAVTLGVTDELELTDEPALPDAPPAAIADLLAAAHGGRPELLSARLQVEAQHMAVRMARASYFPQLTLFGGFQFGNNQILPGTGLRNSSDVANPFSNTSGLLTLGGQLSVNVFDTLNTWTATRDAKYEEARLMEEQRRVGRVVDGDVRVAHAKVLHLLGRRTPLVAARDIAKDNVAILEARYKNGDALVIEFLDAQNDLGQAELNVVDVDAQLYLAWLELDATLGQVVGAH